MDISFQTSAGDGTWSLEKCAAWASEHDFDCVRLADRGVLESNRVLTEGPDEVLETLDRHGLYLACVTSHCNLLDEREEERTSEQSRLIRAIESAAVLGCPVVVTGSGSPVMNGRFYGTFSYPPGNVSDRSDELVEQFAEMFAPVVKPRRIRTSRLPWMLQCAWGISVAIRRCGTRFWTRCRLITWACLAIHRTGCG